MIMVGTQGDQKTNAGPTPRTGTGTTARKATTARGPQLTRDQIWRAIARASFCVVSHVTPAGEPRSSGVIYRSVGRRLYMVVAPDGWKAKHIADGGQVAVTVPVRRGGLLTLLFPIPPATISFHARAIVHPAGAVDFRTLPKELVSLLPPSRSNQGCVIELLPEGAFLTYGLGVSLLGMRDPVASRARVPVG
jgi:hypothetical protein